MPSDQPNRRFDHFFAVIRFDQPADPENWHSAVSIVKIFSNREEAKSEAKRLGAINDLSKCAYEVQIARSGIEN